MQPTLEQLSADNSDVNFYTVDVDDQDTLAAEFGVRSIPTVVAFKDGTLTGAAIVGNRPAATYQSLITQLQNSDN